MTVCAQTENKDQQDAAGGQETAPPTDVVEFAESYDRRHANQKPKVGDLLPDAKAWTENGEPFELKETRGKYTVLVFGCLT